MGKAIQLEDPNASSGSYYSEDSEVCFWDYDGTLIYGCSLEEAHEMTAMPNVPDHSLDEVPLTFIWWTHDLSDIQSLEYPADVGACYKPTDDKWHFTYRLNTVTGLTVSFMPRLTGSVDWGDGTVEPCTTNNVTFTHTYSDYGDWHVTVNKTGASGNYIDINGPFTPSGSVVGTIYIPSVSAWNWITYYGAFTTGLENVDYIVWPFETFGSSVILTGSAGYKHFNIKTYNINNQGSYKRLERIVFKTWNTGGTYDVAKSKALKRIRFGTNSFQNRAYMYQLPALKEVSGVMNIVGSQSAWFNDGSLFYGSSLLERVAIGANCTELPYQPFYNCNNLRELKFYSTTPPTLGSASIPTNTQLKIHVPAESLTAYQEATNWSTYADYFVGDL